MMYAKSPRQRNQHLLDMAEGKRCLLLCVHNCQGDYGLTTVAAHRNEGKGKGLKRHDFETVWGCGPCHEWYDQSGAPLAEKRRAFNAAHERQIEEWRKIADSYSTKQKDQKAALWALQNIEERK
jgi:hypothetical protein